MLLTFCNNTRFSPTLWFLSEEKYLPFTFFHTNCINAKDYIRVKQPSTYAWSKCKPSKISSILSVQRKKKNKHKTLSKCFQSVWNQSENEKWALLCKFILWPDAYNLIQLTYWSFSCYCNCLQKNLNNASTNSWWILFANIKVPKDFLYYMMGILCLLKNQTENLSSVTLTRISSYSTQLWSWPCSHYATF